MAVVAQQPQHVAGHHLCQPVAELVCAYDAARRLSCTPLRSLGTWRCAHPARTYGLTRGLCHNVLASLPQVPALAAKVAKAFEQDASDGQADNAGKAKARSKAKQSLPSAPARARSQRNAAAKATEKMRQQTSEGESPLLQLPVSLPRQHSGRRHSVARVKRCVYAVRLSMAVALLLCLQFASHLDGVPMPVVMKTWKAQGRTPTQHQRQSKRSHTTCTLILTRAPWTLCIVRLLSFVALIGISNAHCLSLPACLCLQEGQQAQAWR